MQYSASRDIVSCACRPWDLVTGPMFPSLEKHFVLLPPLACCHCGLMKEKDGKGKRKGMTSFLAASKRL